MRGGWSIRAADNGYILTDRLGFERIATTLESAFSVLLMSFEGRAETWHGDAYGRVIIDRQEPPR